MRARLKSALTVVLCAHLSSAVAGELPAAQGETSGWDDVLLVSARKTTVPGHWLVCPAAMSFAAGKCVTSLFSPGERPQIKTLQQVLDDRAPQLVGYKTVAVGPIPVHYVDEGGYHVNDQIYLAYRHVPLNKAEIAAAVAKNQLQPFKKLAGTAKQ